MYMSPIMLGFFFFFFAVFFSILLLFFLNFVLFLFTHTRTYIYRERKFDFCLIWTLIPMYNTFLCIIKHFFAFKNFSTSLFQIHLSHLTYHISFFNLYLWNSFNSMIPKTSLFYLSGGCRSQRLWFYWEKK